MRFLLAGLFLALARAFLAGHTRNARHNNQLAAGQTIHSQVDVDLGDRSYPIYIGQGMLLDGALIRKHVKSKKALIVTNTKVGPLYSAQVRKALEQDGKVEVFEVVLPDGEEFKTMDVLMKILDAAMENKLDRKSTMIALGGGVVGDMTGFAAAIYQRGIKFVQIPTTLMAMVDSAVGGKTAVNHPLGKNMIGAFYQPDAVLCDTDSLKTLPDRELCSGIAEVIKYGLIRDADFFSWQEQNMDSIVGRQPAALAECIKRSCENKALVVAADEKEGSGGVRMTLNLGHTFGHAIETGLGYGAWLHGEAVATGTAMAADLSLKMGWIDQQLHDRTMRLFRAAKLPLTLANTLAEADLGKEEYLQRVQSLTRERFLDLMSMDKKVADGQLSLILLEGKLGTSVITSKFDVVKLTEVVDSYVSKK
jgi:3-dehydroquinate synthase